MPIAVTPPIVAPENEVKVLLIKLIIVHLWVKDSTKKGRKALHVSCGDQRLIDHVTQKFSQIPAQQDASQVSTIFRSAVAAHTLETALRAHRALRASV
jgi:hypothetical protein